MGNALCHFELMSNQPDKCRQFYAEVFDWQFRTAPGPGEYTLIETGKEPGGGLMQKPAQAPKPVMNVYFQVEDIEATLAKVAAAGGTTIVPKTPIPGIGHFAMFADPEQICVGIFQPAT